MKERMQCMFRMDDITADMDWDKFNQIRDIFEKYNVQPLLGVVPMNRDSKLSIGQKKEDFWEIIRSLQKQGWKVAQHGTYHEYITNDGGLLGLKKSSEFAGLSYEMQLGKLQKGKQYLEEQGIFSDVFMAPGHTFDRNTVKALYNLGFRIITDGLYHKPYFYGGILFIPCRLQEYRNVKGIDTICLHSNNMTDKQIKELETFCKQYQFHIIPFNDEGLEKQAVKRTAWVVIVERCMLLRRKVKNRIAHSQRLVQYMRYTYDNNSKKKWIKRIVCLPILLIGIKENG